MKIIGLKEAKIAYDKEYQQKIWLNVSRECIRDFDDGERFGSWEKVYKCEVLSFSKEENETRSPWKNSWDTFDISQKEYDAITDSVWAVVVTYSDGDTFGSSSGNIEVACLTVDLEVAKECAAAISKDGRNSGHFDTFRESHPGICKHYSSWTGYFNGVEGIDIIHLSNSIKRIKVL